MACLQVADGDVGPMLLEVLEDEAAMAVFGGGFTAEEDSALVEAHRVQSGLDFAGAHEAEEGFLEDGEVAFLLFEGYEDLFSGGEEGLMLVGGATELAEEEGEIGLLGEAGELGCVAEANVEEALDAVGLEEAEEFLGGFVGEADGVDFHGWPLETCYMRESPVGT